MPIARNDTVVEPAPLVRVANDKVDVQVDGENKDNEPSPQANVDVLVELVPQEPVSLVEP